MTATFRTPDPAAALPPADAAPADAAPVDTVQDGFATADFAPERALAERLFADLHAIGWDGVGITRESYGRGETAAMDHLADLARGLGLAARHDAVGNLVLSDPAHGPGKPLLIGSHLDSVPQGGNFDGAAGVVAGLLVLHRLRRLGQRPPRPVQVLSLRAEESPWFGRPNLGSHALFGLVGDEDLAVRRRGTGETLAEAMEAAGAAVAQVRAGATILPPDSVAGYLELHIEQGPVLIARDLPVGIVTGIRGNIRHNRILCRGESGHSGAIPRWLRKDAVLGFADLARRIEDRWEEWLAQGRDIVVTMGVVTTNPEEHAISRIPGEIAFSFEVRSIDPETIHGFHALLLDEIRAVEAARGLSFALDRGIFTAPARMDPALVDGLCARATALGLAPERLASGAGHDAAIFANAGVPSGLIFVRNANGSHNPREAMEIDDFIEGLRLLAAAATDPALLPG